jgi:hypothetical protein
MILSRHSREGGNPATFAVVLVQLDDERSLQLANQDQEQCHWTAAFAGMTAKDAIAKSVIAGRRLHDGIQMSRASDSARPV